LRHEQQRPDQRDVEQGRRERGRGEARQRIEYAREERHQANEDQIGKGDLRQIDREGELLRLVAPAGADYPHEGRHEDDENDGDRHQDRHEHGQHFLGEALGLVHAAFAVEALAEQGHEALAERALAEQAAEQIGDDEGQGEHVGGHAGAHHPAEDHLPAEAEDAADKRQPADRAGCLDEVHLCPGVGA
jgi:hypothetical protein